MDKQTLINFYVKYKFILFPVLVAVSSLILILFAIIPQINSLLSTNKTIGSLSNKFTALETKAKELDLFDEEDLNRKVGITINALPQESDSAQVLGILQLIALQSQFILSSFSIERGSQASKANSYGAKLELLGPKLTLSNLLDDIEDNPRIMKVGSLDISSARDNNAITLNMSVDVYFEPLPKSIGGSDAPLPKLSSEDEELIATLAKSAPSGSDLIIPTDGGAGPVIPTGPKGKPNPFE